MNKKQLAEQAHRIIVGGDITPEQDYTMQEMRLAVGQIADAMMLNYLIQINKGTRDMNVPREFLRSESVAITDKIGTFTGKPLKLPFNKTIYEVEIDDENCGIDGEFLVPITKSRSLFKMREGSALEGMYGYQIESYSEGIKIRLMNTGSEEIASILVYHVPSSTGISDDDDLHIPEALRNDIIIQTIKTFSPGTQIPDDLKQDNA